MISPAMRDVLIEHIDGPVAIMAPSGCTWGRLSEHNGARAARFRTMKALLERGLLRCDANIRPRFTQMTESGRAALAEALADAADALVRAGQLRADAIYARLSDSEVHDAPAGP
jgi:hypothetical protein